VTTPEPERCGNAGDVEAVENQTTVFHRFHRPLEIAHFAISTFPQRRRLFSLIQTETNTPPFASVGRSGQEQDRRKEASGSVRRRRQPALVSGSSRIGNKSRFQAHSALEINFDFRLISGLENASFDPAWVHFFLREPSSAPPSTTFALPQGNQNGKPVFPLHSMDASPTLTARWLHFAAPTASVYPVATGKAAILRTIAPKSRCVRWFSARSSQ
jgi:hypothetical protein